MGQPIEHVISDAGPTWMPRLDYLMTLHAPGDPSLTVDAGLTIYRTGTDGWAAGPRLAARILQPSCDWLQVLPSGVLRVDVRMTLACEDDALIHVSYNGVIDMTVPVFTRLQEGGQLGAADLYFVIAPTFRTAHPDYLWLNRLQAVGRMTGLQLGLRGFVRYDIFAIN